MAHNNRLIQPWNRLRQGANGAIGFLGLMTLSSATLGQGMPTLLDPGDDEGVYGPQVTVSWTQGNPSPEIFRLQYMNKDTGYVSGAIDLPAASVTCSPQCSTTLALDAETGGIDGYWWRMREKVVGGGWSTWTSKLHFDVVTPTTVIPDQPQGLQSVLQPVTFSWALSPTDGYARFVRIVVRKDSNTGPVVYNPVVDGESVSQHVSTFVGDPDTTYFWRTRADYGVPGPAPSAWSSWNSFTTPVSQVEPPNLLAPVDGSNQYDNYRPQLSWTSVSGATKYLLSVDKVDSSGSTNVIHEPNLTTTSFTPVADLVPGDYQWSVQAFVAGQWTDPSLIWDLGIRYEVVQILLDNWLPAGNVGCPSIGHSHCDLLAKVNCTSGQCVPATTPTYFHSRYMLDAARAVQGAAGLRFVSAIGSDVPTALSWARDAFPARHYVVSGNQGIASTSATCPDVGAQAGRDFIVTWSAANGGYNDVDQHQQGYRTSEAACDDPRTVVVGSHWECASEEGHGQGQASSPFCVDRNAAELPTDHEQTGERLPFLCSSNIRPNHTHLNFMLAKPCINGELPGDCGTSFASPRAGAGFAKIWLDNPGYDDVQTILAATGGVEAQPFDIGFVHAPDAFAVSLNSDVSYDVVPSEPYPKADNCPQEGGGGGLPPTKILGKSGQVDANRVSAWTTADGGYELQLHIAEQLSVSWRKTGSKTWQTAIDLKWVGADNSYVGVGDRDPDSQVRIRFSHTDNEIKWLTLNLVRPNRTVDSLRFRLSE